MAVSIGLFWVLAVVVFVISQWIAPALLSSQQPNTPSGLNYGALLGVPFIKTWGLWVAGGLFVLGPFAALWRALERGGEAIMGRAIGTSNNRRRRR
jgi:hypothetical protein